MAEFLIKNFDSRHSNPTVDATLERIGDIVEVRPDGAVYGRLELLPEKFLIIKVPGLDYAASLQFMEGLVDDADPENPITKKIRKWTIEDVMAFLGPYLVSGNIYQVAAHASWNSFLKEKTLV